MRISIVGALVAFALAPQTAVHGVACNTPLPFCNADVAPIGGNSFVNVDDLLAVINTWGANGVPTNTRPQGDTAPPPNGNCFVNVDDLLAVINTWGACPPPPTGACWLSNNSCIVFTQAQCTMAGGVSWVSGATCADFDGDRIPNVFELNNCSAPAGAFLGTNPNNADTDGDSLRDGDERYGTLGGLNLPALGCSPLRKNAVIEVDWFDDSADGGAHTHQPTATAVNALIAAFNGSPVTNVCGGTGVALIVDYGQGGAFTGGNLIPGGDTVIIFDSEFNTYKATHFAANRNGFVYYSIHAHRYGSATNSSSGFAEINGDDHVVTLQNFLSDSNISASMMHEFGHNLNLRHGGNQDLNYKPNYNSVMNYRYTFPGIDTNCDAVGDFMLNYSTGTRITLNENALNEGAGVCGAVAIDWNGGGISPGTVARNINCIDGSSTACGSASAQCEDSVCGTYSDFNDWGNISFTGLFEGDFASREIIHCDPPRRAPRD